MKVLILGGTGAMGVHLVHLLAEKGCETFVTSRQHKAPEGTVRYLQGDAKDQTFLDPILRQKWDAIVDFMVYSTSEFAERVQTLVAATSQYVFLSSSRVYAGSQTPLIENSPRLLEATTDAEFLATDEYGLSKARQETTLRDSGRTNWTVIRPYITYSETRLQLGPLEKEEWLYRAMKGRTVVFSRDIHERLTTMTYGFDVARGILAIIGQEKALGEAFHITGGEARRWKEVFALYAEVLEKHLGKAPKLRLLELEGFLDVKPSKYQVIYDRFYDRTFDNAKITEFVDVSTFAKLDASLRSCLAEFLRHPRFGQIQWGSEARMDRAAGERTSLSEIPGLKNKLKYLRARYF